MKEFLIENKLTRKTAVKFETNNDYGCKNLNEISLWINQGRSADEPHAWHNGIDLFIQTLEGTMKASVGDWIVKGVVGEYYPCRGDVFEKSYSLVEELEK